MYFLPQCLPTQACASHACLFLATSCADGQRTAYPAQSAAVSPAKAEHAKVPARKNAVNVRCVPKCASRDIFVRVIVLGRAPVAQEPGGWIWDHVTNKCATTVDMIISTAPTASGNRAHVAYAQAIPAMT